MLENKHLGVLREGRVPRHPFNRPLRQEEQTPGVEAHFFSLLRHGFFPCLTKETEK